jgi:hypothetical protein
VQGITAQFKAPDVRNFAPENLEALRPFVVNLTLGAFSNEGIMRSTRADVDDIFEVHLPTFIERARRNGATGPVPLVVWAHGGVVSERAGLSIASDQVPWWLDNGVYPLHFVWETGFVDTLKQLLGWRGRPAAVTQAEVERASELRSGPDGWGLWSTVKQNAASASGPDGGARYVAERLAQFCADHDGVVSLHGAGHSAGAVFHAHFIPTARAVGGPAFATVQLLAPALRVDGFRTQLLPMVGRDIDEVTLYTMNIQAENDDNCFQIYRKSMLYLVSQMFEPEDDAPIVGLEESIRNDPELMDAFGLTPGAAQRVEVVWSPTDPDAPLDSRTRATSHGDFDNDPDTMNSVLRRILGRPEIVEFPAQRRRQRRGLEARMAAPPWWADESRPR